MRLLKTIILFTLFYFIEHNAEAQWHELPPLEVQPNFGMGCGLSGQSLLVPYRYLYPASNGEIIYDVACTGDPSSGLSYQIMESQNDLGNDIARFMVSGMECCSPLSMCSLNDSTHAFNAATDFSGYYYL